MFSWCAGFDGQILMVKIAVFYYFAKTSALCSKGENQVDILGLTVLISVF
jgi:hypothetical protein